MYRCPYPDCDWERQYAEGHTLSELASRADAKRHAEKHERERQPADHTCGYCGLEFDGDEGDSCPRCRSRKKEAVGQ